MTTKFLSDADLVNITPELIGQWCAMYLSFEQREFVADATVRQPERLALFANGDKSRSFAHPRDVAFWWLEKCREAVSAGDA